jgi:hypothetical protein
MTNRVPERPAPAQPPTPARPADSHPQPTPAPDLTEVDVEHEGGTEDEIGELTGPGAGYDDEPEQVDDQGGVA